MEYRVESVGPPSLFSTLPTILAGGDIVFQIAPGRTGTASFVVRAFDDGGVVNGGVDYSAAKTFFIEVLPYSRAPTFALQSDVVVHENSGFTEIVTSNPHP